ncbi:hypothetical protein PBY51_000233 [Eleginops maclovinus]|uniref:Uncharacterized protein n=1 Tax=Eleginops maclovinus TaxID=56733 RepID=A0AAN7XLU5_ELEMC|nr:hypothetical protein PBY51_000233 [Eleginops maclovinus]
MEVDGVVSTVYFLTVAARLISEKSHYENTAGYRWLITLKFLVWSRQLAAASESGSVRERQRQRTTAAASESRSVGNVRL